MKSKIKKVKAAWFRGFSDERELVLSDKSLAVYGENGSGKSSYVDVIEYLMRGGLIEHLRHEYSGRRQEKGVVNTHKPTDKQCSIEVELEDGTVICATIQPNGSFVITPETNDLITLEHQRVILRQDEVADFIKETKGEKYSSLLPLLGLGDAELIIENVKKLDKAIRDESRLSFKKGEIQEIKNLAIKQFGVGGRQAMYAELDRLYKKYVPKGSSTDPENQAVEMVNDILAALKQKVDDQEKEQAIYGDITSISRLEIEAFINQVRIDALKLAKSSEPFITEKLEVLNKASSFVDKLDVDTNVECPACGSEVSSHDFKAHVQSEHTRLNDAVSDFNAFKRSVSNLADALQTLKSTINKGTLKEWVASNDTANVTYVKSLNVAALRSACQEEDLKEFEAKVLPLIISATAATKDAPPEVKELVAEKETADLIQRFVASLKTSEYVTSVEALLTYLSNLQAAFREKIKTQSSASISAISDDIARMWQTLHPEESIEGVHMYLPADQDKAIEIGLKFYGVDQGSPRLTLSEGHRNSLGLCIFLAMAKNTDNPNIPIVLDDVVVSFDRNHRGRVATLLEQELKDRQIILFTHDREWFIEIKHLLDASQWEFRALMPWQNPNTGIRWSSKDSTFDDARDQIETDPSVAGNTARKIMDVSLALLAEKLELKMPYLHREKNDHRISHDFLTRIISDSDKCFQIKNGTNYEINTAAIDSFKKADKHLMTRGNRSSHTFSLTNTEAIDLINSCEEALDNFICKNCKKPVTKLEDASAEFVQCECGQLRWRYGKS